MSRTAIAALLGVGGALMIMKGIAGNRSLSETWEGYTGGKPKEDAVDPEVRDKSEEDWKKWQGHLQSLGFRAPISGRYDEGTQRAVEEFERVCGLEEDGIWDAELEETIMEEIEFLEKNGMPRWFCKRLEPQGYQSLEDFERSGQGYFTSSEELRGSAFVKDESVGRFDPASLELAQKYEPYWELSVPLPGPQFMTWDKSKKKLVLGPYHLYAQAEVILAIIEKYKDNKALKDTPREWLDQYDRLWSDAPFWQQGLQAYGALVVLGPLYAPAAIGDRVLKYWHEQEFEKGQSTQQIRFKAFMRGLNAAAKASRLMFADGKQMAIKDWKDWKANTEDKQAAIAEYAMMLQGIVSGLVEAYKANEGSVREAQIEGRIKAVIRKSRDVPNQKIIVLEERS